MKALLICPDAREEVAFLARACPLALFPFLGKPLIDHAITALAERGVKRLVVLASDRPGEIREFVNEGKPWGIEVEVRSEPEELSADAARAKYVTGDGWTPEPVTVLDRLPDEAHSPLFSSYGELLKVMSRELKNFAPRHVGARELKPGVWAGLKARVAGDAELTAPCWIGDHAWVRSGARLGPDAFIESHAMIDDGAIVEASYVGPHTYVGQLTEVRNSYAIGNGLLNWETGSSLEIVDEFLLSSLRQPRGAKAAGSLPGRLAALLLLLLTWPVVLIAWLRNLGSGRPLFESRAAVAAPRPAHRVNTPAVRYSRLNGFSGPWSRWPELWQIVRGKFRWVGNRPVAPEEVKQLEGEFEELWLDAPTGLWSLADLENCADPFSDEGKAHASFFAVRSDARLRRRILFNLIRRALTG